MTDIFPPGFLWGASTSAHQTEGNNVAANWWALENAEGSGLQRAEGSGLQRSGDAVDSYHRYPEDMDLLSSAGLNAYRFSIEWARIEPTPGQFSRAALDHYRRMITAAQHRGLAPIVTIHHFTVPTWFADNGGWLHPQAVERFGRYVEYASRILGDVEWVCTINEPNMIAVMTVVLSRMQDAAARGAFTAQRLPEPDEAVSSVLTEAHHNAAKILRTNTDAKIGWTVAQQAFTPTAGNEDVFAQVKYAWEDSFLAAGRGDDFIGVQAYTSQPVDQQGPVPHPPRPDNTLVGGAYRPDALGIALRNAWEIGNGTPLLVTENGIATDDDQQRIAYTSAALQHLQAAIADRIDVRGYLHWSALDNYEWGHWTPTFGLIAVDRETFQPTPKPSLAWLGNISRSNSLDGIR